MSDPRMIRIEDKLDKIADRLNCIDVTLVSQHDVLNTHIARTEALEAIVKPLHRQSLMAIGAYRLVGILGGLIGFSAAVFEIMSYFKRK